MSLLVDLFWFMTQDYSNQQDDGGIEKGIRSFSLTMSYISFFFRIIVALVFMKDSQDFNRIIKKQQNQIEVRNVQTGGVFGSSPDKMRAAINKKIANDVAKKYKQQDQQNQQQYNRGGTYQQNQDHHQLQMQSQNYYQQQRTGGPGGNNNFDMGRR